MFALLLKETALLPALDLSSVREIYLGSAPAADDLFIRLGRAFPGAEIVFGYGTTESGPVAFTRHPDGRRTPIGSVGVAHPQAQLRLVDPTGRPGDAGVLELRTGALFTGYFRRPDIVAPITPDGFQAPEARCSVSREMSSSASSSTSAATGEDAKKCVPKASW